MLAKINRAILPVVFVILGGCDAPEVAPKSVGQQIEKRPVETASLNATVAMVNGNPITVDVIDERIKLSLFDLEWRRYELRKVALKHVVGELIESGNDSTQNSVELLLAPPLPPRVSLPLDGRPVKGSRDAIVQLQIFCSYQSPHCARLQPVVDSLMSLYKNHLNVRYYDYPQSFHRYAHAAANAVRCAAEQEKQWAYQTSVYSAIDQLNEERYRLIATQQGMSIDSFSRCFDEKRYSNLIKQDIELGQSLGFGNVPVVLINGLYVKGPQPIGVYQHYIDGELAQKGVTLAGVPAQNSDSKDRSALKLSTLPIRLLATSLSNKQEESTAIVEFIERQAIRTYKQGEPLQDKVLLLAIEENRIIIDNEGVKEYIRLQSGSPQEVVDADVDSTEVMPVSVDNEGETREGQAQTPYKKRTLPAKGEMVLSRDWVEEQLANKEELQKHFQNAEHVVEGFHLIRLENIEDERFYRTLGLQSGDVIMRVGDEWVHEGQNPLWDTLEKEDSITLVLMRKGLPVRYDYKVEK